MKMRRASRSCGRCRSRRRRSSAGALEGQRQPVAAEAGVLIAPRPGSRTHAYHRLIFVLVPLLVVMTVSWRYWRQRRQEYPLIAERGKVEGIPALEEGNFDKAYQLLSAAKAAVNALGGAVDDADTIRNAADEAAIFVDQAPISLEEMLEQAGRTDPQSWATKFDAVYKGRAVSFDTWIIGGAGQRRRDELRNPLQGLAGRRYHVLQSQRRRRRAPASDRLDRPQRISTVRAVRPQGRRPSHVWGPVAVLRVRRREGGLGDPPGTQERRFHPAHQGPRGARLARHRHHRRHPQGGSAVMRPILPLALTILIFAPMSEAAFSFSADQPVVVEPADLGQRQDLIGKDVVIDDHVEFYVKRAENEPDELQLKRTPMTFLVPRDLRPASTRMTSALVRGVLRRDGNRLVCDVSELKPLPKDLDRLERGLAGLPAKDYETRKAWVRWAERRAKDFNDKALRDRARLVEADVLRIESEMKRLSVDAPSEWLAMALDARRREVPEPEPSALGHRAFRAKLAAAEAAAELKALIQEIESFFPRASTDRDRSRR